MLAIRDDDVEGLLDAADAIALLDEGYRRAARGRILTVPWSTVHLAAGAAVYQTHELRAALPEEDVWAMRVAHRVQPGGARAGYVFLFSLSSGELLATIEDERLQLLRVAAASAVGVRHLANPGPATLGILGAGRQAAAQLEAVALVRPLARALVYSPTPERREGFAREHAGRCPFPVEAAPSAEAVVRRADLLTSAASAAGPTFPGTDVRPGTHVNVVSALHADAAILGRSAAFTCTKRRPTEHRTGGARTYEGESPLYRRWDELRELERVMSGEDAGRSSRDEITLFYAHASGLQFAVLGLEIYRRAAARGLGRSVELW